MLEFWQRVLSMMTKLASHCKVRTYPLAQQIICEGIGRTPQQRFSNECLEVYDVIFGLIQWRFEQLREVYYDFNCVTSDTRKKHEDYYDFNCVTSDTRKKHEDYYYYY